VYEVGLKGSWTGFGFNLALFKQNITGFQSNVFVGTGFVLGNAPKQSVKGFELDMTASPTRNLNFTFSTTYLDALFDSFPGGTAFNPATNNTGPADLTGRRPSGIPEWSMAVGGTWSIPLADNKLILHADYQFDSAYQIAQGLPFKAAPESLNASVTFQVNNGLELTAWGRNLTSPNYNSVIFPSVAQSGSLSGYPSPPAFYGASARFKF
jgi:outer membrane receptor protein involved in Fe transport